MKKSSKLFHSLLHSAIRFPAKFSSPPVAPWPPLQSSFDGWFYGELDSLRSSPNTTTTSCSTRWLLCAFDLALAAQKTAIKSILTTTYVNREIIEDHLEDVIDLLDMCNSLRVTVENIKNYIDLLRIVLHWLEGNNSSPNKTGLARAHSMLSSGEEMERKFSEIVKCRSFSFGKKQGRGGSVHETVTCEETELYEALNGSKAITSLACGALNRALSLKPKRVGLRKMKSFSKTTSCWSVSFHELREEVEKGGKFSELRDTVMAVKQLRNLVSKEPAEMKDKDYWEKDLRDCVEGLKRSCEGIEGEIVKPLEGKMDELYRDLITVRMGLLGLLSQTQTGIID